MVNLSNIRCTIHTIILTSLSALATLAGGMGGILGGVLTDAALFMLGSRATVGLCPFFLCVAGDSLGEDEGEGSLGLERSGVSGGLS